MNHWLVPVRMAVRFVGRNIRVVVVLVMTGMISVEKLREIRSFVIVGAFVVAAVVTPPDVVSQLMLAIPLCLLYEVGIFFARFVAKPREAAGADAS